MDEGKVDAHGDKNAQIAVRIAQDMLDKGYIQRENFNGARSTNGCSTPTLSRLRWCKMIEIYAQGKKFSINDSQINSEKLKEVDFILRYFSGWVTKH